MTDEETLEDKAGFETVKAEHPDGDNFYYDDFKPLASEDMCYGQDVPQFKSMKLIWHLSQVRNGKNLFVIEDKEFMIFKKIKHSLCFDSLSCNLEADILRGPYNPDAKAIISVEQEYKVLGAQVHALEIIAHNVY